MNRLPISRSVAFVAFVTLACSDLVGPPRSDVYEWRRFLPTATGTDILSFHWPASSLPVKIWVEDRFGMPAHLTRAIDLWKEAFLYGEYDARVVADSNAADVIVLVPDGIPPLKGPSFRLGAPAAPECEGATDIVLSPDGRGILLPIHIYLVARFNPATSDLSPCFALTSAHELGHSLGIFQHSPDPLDLMFSDPAVSRPSDRDIRTAEVAAHYPANLTPVRASPTAAVAARGPTQPDSSDP